MFVFIVIISIALFYGLFYFCKLQKSANVKSERKEIDNIFFLDEDSSTPAEKEHFLEIAKTYVDKYTIEELKEIRAVFRALWKNKLYITTINNNNLERPLNDFFVWKVREPKAILESFAMYATADKIVGANLDYPKDLKTKKAIYQWGLENAEEVCKKLFPDYIAVTPSWAMCEISCELDEYINDTIEGDYDD